MTFSPSFGRPFSPSFKPNSLAEAVVASDWWLSGGISAANCDFAFRAKGAADYAASKVNLANPGTYNASNGAAYPSWSSAGWAFTYANSEYLDVSGLASGDRPITYIFSLKIGSVSLSQNHAIVSTNTNGALIIMHDTYFDNATLRRLNGAEIVTTNRYILTADEYDIVALVWYADGSWKSYINGVEDKTGTQTTAVSSGTVRIGTPVQGGMTAMDGTLASIARYNTSLTPTQIASLSSAMAAH